MPSRNPTDELLTNLLVEVENVINTRSLTYLSFSFGLIKQMADQSKPAGEFPFDVFILRKKWNLSQNLANLFWRRWICDYLPASTKRKQNGLLKQII